MPALLVAVASIAGAVIPAAAADEVTPMIIGGHEATGPTDWAAAVIYDAPAHDRYDWKICDGALVIDRKTVITGAPCVTDFPDAPPRIPVADRVYKVRLGSKDRTAGGVVVPVAKITVHPEWQWGAAGPGVPQADIAVLTLAHRVDIQPLQLASTPGGPGDPSSVNGWGVDSPDSQTDPTQDSMPRRLQQLDTKVIAPARCTAAEISPKDICLENPNGTDGPCAGNSGGVVTRESANGVKQYLGSVSRSGPGYCGTTPFVATSAPEYRQWLYEVARGAPATGAVSLPSKVTPPVPVP